MHELVVEYFSRPFLGLALLVRLFTGHSAADLAPSIHELKLITDAGSVYLHVGIRNGFTPSIRELLYSGTEIVTTCRYACDTTVLSCVRTFRHNPISGETCMSAQSSTCDTLSDTALAARFNTLVCYMGEEQKMRSMARRTATVSVEVSGNIDAYRLGERELWPRPAVVEFVVPLAESDSGNR